MELVKEVYFISHTFPANEMYGLTSQLRRAVVSIPTNIAEGCGRQNSKDTIHFLHLSRGSLYEVETLINIGKMIEILNSGVIDKILGMIDRIRQILNDLIRRPRDEENWR